MTLAVSKKGTEHYDSWAVQNSATNACLGLADIREFNSSTFPGYSPKNNDGSDALKLVPRAKTYIFMHDTEVSPQQHLQQQKEPLSDGFPEPLSEAFVEVEKTVTMAILQLPTLKERSIMAAWIKSMFL